ncbi:VWA domain-containing protein [Marinobacter halodurans]|nr:VWA domain-containing protein [Marinobacter halodurans]
MAQSADGAKSPALPEPQDVRIVVDISGSMKDSDPNNLRRPAVRLLARMLPDDARGGVWTFGQYVNMLVPSGEVTPKWREMAVKRSPEINSVALRTNIGEALEVASDDFYGDRRFDNTHFILLTDGVVDISRDAAVNARERNRILDEVVDRIRSRGATIHTIALSDNADLALLERLAVETGGTFSVAPDADALNRVFAETLNTAAPQPEVPIENKRFRISEDVHEFTALIFHEGDDQPLALMTPDRKRVTHDRHPDNVRWYSEEAYDLITVDKPAEGEWQVDGELGAQSRVTVVSDLRMAVSPLPNFFYTGQPVSVDASFYDHDKPITNPDFLGVLDVSLTLSTQDGRSGTKRLSGETPPADGVYSDTIDKLSEPGTYDLKLVADGKTFARQFSARITLRPPVSVTVEGEGQGSDSQYVLEVRPEHPDLDRHNTMVGVRVQAPGQGDDTGFDKVPFDEQAGVWRKVIKPSSGDGDYQISVRFQGSTDSGQPLNYSPPAFTATFPRQGGDQAAYTSLSAETVTQAGDEQPAGTAPESSTTGQPLLSEAAATPEPAAQEPTADESGDEPPAEAATSEPAIAPPIDTSQVETPAEPEPSPAPAAEPEPKAAPEPQKSEEASLLASIPAWAWGAGGGLLAIAAMAFAVVRARRKGSKADGDPDARADADEPSEPAVDEEPEEQVEPEADSEEPPVAVADDAVTGEAPEEETEIPPVVEEEPPLAEEPTPDGMPAAEEEAEPPLASETAEPTAGDVDEEIPTLDEQPPEIPAADEEWPTDEEPGALPREADETADDIERFLEEARRDEADLAAADEDILADPAGTEDEEDDYSLEDFDLSDIDDLPDLEDEERKRGDSEGEDPDDKKSE